MLNICNNESFKLGVWHILTDARGEEMAIELAQRTS